MQTLSYIRPITFLPLLDLSVSLEVSKRITVFQTWCSHDRRLLMDAFVSLCLPLQCNKRKQKCLRDC